MSSPTVFQGDMIVRGRFQADAFTPPDDSIGGGAINAADPIPVEKVEHQYVKTVGQVTGTAATTNAGEVIHVANGPGTIVRAFARVMVAAAGAATVAFDVKKNGVSILSGAMTIDNTIVAFTGNVEAAFTALDYNADDVFSVSWTATAGGGTLPQGVAFEMIFREDQT